MEDKELMFNACHFWANHIETGNLSMSAVDAKNQGKPDKVKALNRDQMETILRLRNLGDSALRSYH